MNRFGCQACDSVFNSKLQDPLCENCHSPNTFMLEQALRYNEGKLQWHLLHIPFIEGIIKVLEFGKEKYSEDNWKKPMDRNTILDSQMRHQAALMKGEEIDPESGLPHVFHLACNAMFYSYHSK